MENDVKSQRTFLLAVLGAIGIFALMFLFFSHADSTETLPQLQDSNANASANTATGAQDVYIKALNTGGYDNPNVTVKKGVPVRLHFSADQGAGCGRSFVMKKFGVQLTSSNGEEKTATFTPNETGTFEYSCSMRMFRGTMTVVA